MEKFVDLVGPHGEGIAHLVRIERLPGPGDFPRVIQIDIRVDKHLGVNAEIFEIAFGDHGPHDVRQTADPQLEAAAVLDLRENTLHWLDVSAKGQLAFNNVHSSNRAITTIGPKLIAYFESGHRPSMFDLALLHAAARCRRVILRGPTPKLFVRREGESVRAFHLRLRAGKADEQRMPALEHPTFAALEHGDLPLPEGSTAWALFREGLTDTLAASDLLS